LHLGIAFCHALAVTANSATSITLTSTISPRISRLMSDAPWHGAAKPRLLGHLPLPAANTEFTEPNFAHFAFAQLTSEIAMIFAICHRDYFRII
jgi:hypothetical protein